MPVRSLNSRVLKWPARAEVDRAVRELAARLAREHAGLLRFGYFGSYARGDAGPGSDVDLVAVVKDSGRAFHERPLDFDVAGLPVGAELLVYTLKEWHGPRPAPGRFLRQLESETVWVLP
jgi:predicted nucleotidyltransferase